MFSGIRSVRSAVDGFLVPALDGKFAALGFDFAFEAVRFGTLPFKHRFFLG